MRQIQPANETDLGKEILAVVNEAPGIYTADLARAVGKAADPVRRKCYRLQGQHLLVGVPKEKPNQWFPKNWQPHKPEPEPPAEFRMPPAPLLF